MQIFQRFFKKGIPQTVSAIDSTPDSWFIREVDLEYESVVLRRDEGKIYIPICIYPINGRAAVAEKEGYPPHWNFDAQSAADKIWAELKQQTRTTEAEWVQICAQLVQGKVVRVERIVCQILILDSSSISLTGVEVYEAPIWQTESVHGSYGS